MRKISSIILFIALLTAGGILYTRFANPCAEPIHYALGNFDARFGITKTEFLKVATNAETLWEKPTGKELFVYDPNSSFKINLIYDDRQARTNQYTQIQDVLDASANQYQSLKDEYAALNNEYNQKQTAYETEVDQFNKDRATYNNEVDYWNNRGGAPAAEFKKLSDDGAALQTRGNTIDADREELNALGRRINVVGSQANNFANSYNTVATTYNQEFGTSTEFDQGEYKGTEIDIYEFKGTQDLEVVMSHEFGHALGLQHVNDPKAVMYYLMGEQDLSSPHTTTADLNELKAVCKFK